MIFSVKFYEYFLCCYFCQKEKQMKYHVILMKNAIQRLQQLCDCSFRNRIKEYKGEEGGTHTDVTDDKIKCDWHQGTFSLHLSIN